MKLESFSPQAELLKEQQVEKRNLAAENEPGARIVLGEGQAFLENEKIVGLESPEAKQFDKWAREIAEKMAPGQDISDYVFLIQDSEDVNAFISKSTAEKTPVVFSKGIIKLFENKDQLAYVLGHELVHRILDKEIGTGPNSRIEEGIADLKPIQLLHDAGFDARQAYELTKKMKQGYPSGKLLDIHGDWDNRLLQVKNFLAGLDSKVGGLKTKPTGLRIQHITDKLSF